MAVPTLRGCVLFRPNVYQEVPDGGWGWLVAVAFFVVEVFTYGTIKCFGIFLQDLMKEFEECNIKVSWLISICVFVMTFMAPLSSVLTIRFGFQPVVMLGGTLIAMGTITTAYTSSIQEMYITTGIVAGLGYCLTFLPTVTILSQYFDRRRSLVTALASTGESFAMFALAPAFAALRDRVGWRHTMVVIGALQGTIIVCGALLRPIVVKPSRQAEMVSLNPKSSSQATTKANGLSPSSKDSGALSLKEGTEDGTLDACDKQVSGWTESDARREAEQAGVEAQGAKEEGATREDGPKPPVDARPKVKLVDFSILREGSFICYSLFGLFATLGFFAPPLYIIDLSVSRGVERDQATYMLSIMAVAEVFGRLSVGWVLTQPRVRGQKLWVLLWCVVSMALVLLVFTLVWEFYGLAACCTAFGFFMGSISCTHIPLLAEDDVVGIERMASAAGVYVFIQSFAGLASSPLGGFLVDETGNYGSAFYSCTAGMALGAVFLGLVKPAKRWLPCKKHLNRPEEETQQEGREDNTEHRTCVSKPSDGGRDTQEIVVELDQNVPNGCV
ncbi:unnamed protein product [Merluccius merluccius]